METIRLTLSADSFEADDLLQNVRALGVGRSRQISHFSRPRFGWR